MKKSFSVLLFCFTYVFAHAFSGTIAFTNGDSIYTFFNEDFEIVYTGNHIIENNKDLSDISFGKETNGSIAGIQYSIKKSNLSQFVLEHSEEISKSDKILIIYDGHFSSLLSIVKELKEVGYEAFKHSRYVQDVQLFGIGNLGHKGLFKIIYEDKVSYVDYDDGVYENKQSIESFYNHVEYDSIQIKSNKDRLSLLIRSSIYYLNIINGNIRDELVFLYQPFPVSILGRDDNDDYYILGTIKVGATLPTSTELDVNAKSGSIIVCFKEKGNIYSLNGTLMCPAYSLVVLPDNFMGYSACFVNANGNIQFHSKQGEENIDLISILLSNNYNDIQCGNDSSPELLRCDDKSSGEKKQRITYLYIFFIFIILCGCFLTYAKKTKAEDLIAKASNKIEANTTRKKYHRIISVIAVATVITFITINVILLASIGGEIWTLLISGSLVLVLFYGLYWSVHQIRTKKESLRISTLTLDQINLDENFILYLRGFRQDDYYTYGRQKDYPLFNEEQLFSLISKQMKAYAIGMTKEFHSPMGAERIYFDEDEWQNGVMILMHHSKAIIINIHNSENCIFEIKESLQYPQKTFYLVTDIEEYNAVIEKIPEYIWPQVQTNNSFFRADDDKIYTYSAETLVKQI